jgi:hypothetical protein
LFGLTTQNLENLGNPNNKAENPNKNHGISNKKIKFIFFEQNSDKKPGNPGKFSILFSLDCRVFLFGIPGFGKKNKNKFLFGFLRFLFGFPRHP